MNTPPRYTQFDPPTKTVGKQLNKFSHTREETRRILQPDLMAGYVRIVATVFERAPTKKA